MQSTIGLNLENMLNERNLKPVTYHELCRIGTSVEAELVLTALGPREEGCDPLWI